MTDLKVKDQRVPNVVLADRIERYSLPTDFGRRYRKKIEGSQNVKALVGARCLRLVKSAGGERIEAAEVVDRAGRKRRIRAEVFVLATGGIEVPRLLMLSDPEGAGLGNAGDCLGRYYMCHFENTAGRVVPHGAKVAFDFERTTDGVYCRRQLRFTPEALERHRLLNMAFRLHFPSYSDATHGSAVMSTIYLAKSTLIPEYRAILEANAETPASPTPAHVRNVLMGLPQLARFAADYVFRIQLARRKLPYTLVPNADGTYPLEFNSEQIPERANRVTLSEEIDRHGLRRVHIDWRLSESDADSACRGYQLATRDVRPQRRLPARIRRDAASRPHPPLGTPRGASHGHRPHGYLGAERCGGLELRRLRRAQSVYCELRRISDQRPRESDAHHRCNGLEAGGASASAIPRPLRPTIYFSRSVLTQPWARGRSIERTLQIRNSGARARSKIPRAPMPLSCQPRST